ncbi:hypothetical protein SLNSH_24245 [Alsobacter soli]|uniref:DUF2946 domain-containing protein n=1 Tax=Alsobacter soli TaxID=2109933 RepID=A0A2T1HLF0_9HYPH|nr:hypothetical protein SLNSH_24245 [Alsobacter soli]
MSTRLPLTGRLARFVAALGLLFLALAYAGPAAAHGAVNAGPEMRAHHAQALADPALAPSAAIAPCQCCVAGPCCCAFVGMAATGPAFSMAALARPLTSPSLLRGLRSSPGERPPRSRHG